MKKQISGDDFLSLMNCSEMAGNQNYCALLYSQAHLECDGFNSQMYWEASNMFGMKCSTERTKYWDGEYCAQNGEVFASYQDDSGQKSLMDRLDWDSVKSWFSSQMPLNTPAGMVQYMYKVVSSGYATDPDYVKKWVARYNMLFPHNQIAKAVFDGVANVYQDAKDAGNSFLDRVFNFLKTAVGLFAVVLALYFYWKNKK